MAAAYAGLVIMLAVKRADAWPFAAMLAVTGLGYLFGLSTYGSGEPDPRMRQPPGAGPDPRSAGERARHDDARRDQHRRVLVCFRGHPARG